MGKTVSFTANGGTTDGYLAEPAEGGAREEGRDRHPGVVGR